MHHFIVDADPITGEWIKGTMNYIGKIEAAEHYAKVDTDKAHYDHADPEAFPIFSRVAGFDVGTDNVALTVIWTE